MLHAWNVHKDLLDQEYYTYSPRQRHLTNSHLDRYFVLPGAMESDNQEAVQEMPTWEIMTNYWMFYQGSGDLKPPLGKYRALRMNIEDTDGLVSECSAGVGTGIEGEGSRKRKFHGGDQLGGPVPAKRVVVDDGGIVDETDQGDVTNGILQFNASPETGEKEDDGGDGDVGGARFGTGEQPPPINVRGGERVGGDRRRWRRRPVRVDMVESKARMNKVVTGGTKKLSKILNIKLKL